MKIKIEVMCLKATIHGATLLLATVVTRLWQPCSRVVTAWLQPGYNCCKQQSCPVYGGLNSCAALRNIKLAIDESSLYLGSASNIISHQYHNSVTVYDHDLPANVSLKTFESLSIGTQPLTHGNNGIIRIIALSIV